MTLPQPQDIEAAARRISGHIRVTPVLQLAAGELAATPMTLKLEYLQLSGSFKVRRAFNTMLSSSVPAGGVLAASGGNHGAAVAYAARALGYSAEIFVPETVPAVKVARLHDYGAQVTVTGRNYSEAHAASQHRASEHDALFIHPYDQASVITGQGTVALEFGQQAELDTVLVAVGGGGLISGVANWFQGRVRVVAVEPFTCASMFTALEAGAPVGTEVSGLAADALGASRVGELAFAAAQRFVERVVRVDDDAIKQSQLALWDSARIAAEPAGVTALAALWSGAYQPEPGERVGVMICGGNVNPQTLI